MRRHGMRFKKGLVLSHLQNCFWHPTNCLSALFGDTSVIPNTAAPNDTQPATLTTTSSNHTIYSFSSFDLRSDSNVGQCTEITYYFNQKCIKTTNIVLLIYFLTSETLNAESELLGLSIMRWIGLPESLTSVLLSETRNTGHAGNPAQLWRVMLGMRTTLIAMPLRIS